MGLKVEQNVPLAALTTLGVGGVARYFVRLGQTAQLAEIADYANSIELPVWVLGGGSNVLITDGVLQRLVVKNELRGMEKHVTADSTLVTAAAGESWDELVAYTVEQGLAGLENLSGIPGTVGAAPIQNINAYGAAVADAIESVQVFDWQTNRMFTLTAKECTFGYRDSIFKQPAGAHWLVTAVTFRLAPAGVTNLQYSSASQSLKKYLQSQSITQPTLAEVRQAVLYVRSNIGMLPGQFRSAGSFFKNTIVDAATFARIHQTVMKQFSEVDAELSPWHWPLPDGLEKISTAFLMECSPYNKQTFGSKRFKDAVGLSPKHSLSIVTEAGATATDVRQFAEQITQSVEDLFGVIIESEVNKVN